MIPLRNFEAFCPDVILERGQSYYEQGLIYSFEALDPFRFSAIVVGTDPYAVHVELDDLRNIRELHCTCPYDLGAICKHKVAVLHRVREYKIGTNTESNHNFARLNEELARMSKAKLIDLIMGAAARDLQARQTLFSMAEVRDVWDPERFWIGDNLDLPGEEA